MEAGSKHVLQRLIVLDVGKVIDSIHEVLLNSFEVRDSQEGGTAKRRAKKGYSTYVRPSGLEDTKASINFHIQ